MSNTDADDPKAHYDEVDPPIHDLFIPLRKVAHPSGDISFYDPSDADNRRIMASDAPYLEDCC